MTAYPEGYWARVEHEGGNTVTFRVEPEGVCNPDYYPAEHGWKLVYLGPDYPRDHPPLSVTDMVREFHEVFGAPIAPEGYQGLGDQELRRLRAELIREEFVELLGALGMAFWDEDEGVWADPEVRRFPGAPLDRIEVADALGDLVYVIYGAALAFGIDLDAVVAEIHRSNMTKLGADGKPIYREGDMKVLKGPAYERPNIRRALGMEES